MSYPVNINDFKMTCSACPSQWEGKTLTGDHVYIRYRWGQLTVGIGDSLRDAIENTTLSKGIDETGWLGMMPTEEMMQHTHGVLDWHAKANEADLP